MEKNKSIKIFYCSPSILPSRTANSIHVVRMCEAFSILKCDVFLISARFPPISRDIEKKIEKYYGVCLDRVALITYFPWINKGINLQLGIFGFINYFKLLLRGCSPDIIISRNLYAAFFFRIFTKKNIYFETHQLELGWRKILQKTIITGCNVKTIVISCALEKLLKEHLCIKSFNSVVLHDAAPSGMKRLTFEEKKQFQAKLLGDSDLQKYKLICGYFGHLYKGRGIEIILQLAEKFYDSLFFIFGGNDEHINEIKKNSELNNLMVMGYVTPNNVAKLMSSMDVLLMPYQRNVSIGDKRSDTSRWMSPIKMFEYMAAGVPIIASDLPVLKEILKHQKNCLLAKSDDIVEWCACLNRIKNDTKLAENIAQKAYQEYVLKYNWNIRAKKIISKQY